MVKSNAAGYFPCTPSIPLLYGLKTALTMLAEDGLEAGFARHRRLAEGARAAVIEGWKLPLCAREPSWYSDTVSAILVPEGIDGAKIIAHAFKRYNLALGAGLARAAGKLFRIGHRGDLNEVMLLGAIAGAEMAMIDCGVNVQPGSGVAAATNRWRALAVGRSA